MCACDVGCARVCEREGVSKGEVVCVRVCVNKGVNKDEVVYVYIYVLERVLARGLCVCVCVRERVC